MSEKNWDVAVVGAGAAGLMTAIWARKEGASVLLLDGREKIGAKILMSGGTRCNVTNETITEKDYESNEKKIVRSILAAFGSKQTLDFFGELGVEFVLEPNGKYFPTTHSGKTILDALMKEADRLGVVLETGHKISAVSAKDGIFKLASDFPADFFAKTVVLTTGGLSFPTSGSDGTGYKIAQSFGHSMVPTSASLTPLKTEDLLWRDLSGLSLPVKLTVKVSGKEVYSFTGDFLFTHFGYSGPSVLNISRHWIRNPAKDTRVEICFLPNWNEEECRKFLIEEAEENPTRPLRGILSEGVPLRLAETIMDKLDIPLDIVINQVSKKQRTDLVNMLFHAVLPVSGDMGYAKAEVTAGGINLAEVNRLTLESKLQKNLFMAGEILDVDGRIGGFNFQWAWASGFTAGKAAAKNAAV